MSILLIASSRDLPPGLVAFFVFAFVVIVAGGIVIAVTEVGKESKEEANAPTPQRTPTAKSQANPQLKERLPMKVNSKLLPEIEGDVRYFQMADQGFVLIVPPPKVSFVDDARVFEYFNICRSFLDESKDKFLNPKGREQEQSSKRARSLSLPDGSEISCKLPSGDKKPTVAEMMELLEFAQHMMELQKSLQSAKRAGKKEAKSDTLKAFAVDSTTTASTKRTTGVPAKG